MQVILKQRDIEQALKQYIAGQGINLKGKTVNIAFTAGRKETGISAELDIDDISGYIPAAEDLTVKDPEVLAQDQLQAPAESENAVATAPAEAVEPVSESPFADKDELAEKVVEESAASKSSSLFS